MMNNLKKTSTIYSLLSWKLAGQFLIGIGSLFFLLLLLGIYLKSDLVFFAEIFVHQFGLGGIFLGVLFTDSTPFLLAHEPLLFLGVKGGLSVSSVLIVASIGSVLSGCLGYFAGNLLGQNKWWQNRFPKGDPLLKIHLQKHGFLVVILGALTPIPFAYTTWMAGMIRLNFSLFFIGCLFRIPRICFYFWLMMMGWNIGSS